ncbi:hypothetical protein PG985_003558 [Apiospora marii]|uniref:Uncharacterized protein n=1 Tax=Apiospora marii TaxID=335849 RepID=A0ABR1SHQ9_9PEZI
MDRVGGLTSDIAWDIPHLEIDANTLRRELDQQELESRLRSSAAATDDGSPSPKKGDEPQRLTRFSTTRANHNIGNDEPPFGTKIYMIWPEDTGWNEEYNQRIDKRLRAMVGAHRMFVSDTSCAGVNFWYASLSTGQVELLREMPEVWDNQEIRRGLTMLADMI